MPALVSFATLGKLLGYQDGSLEWRLQVNIVVVDSACVTDGTFGGDRYFVCGDNDGLFVSLDKISPEPFPTKPKKSVSRSASMPAPGVPAHPPMFELRQFKVDERVMVFNKQGKEVFGRVRWCGDRTKTKNLGFTAVGIETETQVFFKDFEGSIPTGNTFGAPKFHYLLMPQTMVVSAERKQATTKLGTPHSAVRLDQDRPQEDPAYKNIPTTLASDSQRHGPDHYNMRQPHYQGGADYQHNPHCYEQRFLNSAHQGFSSPNTQPRPQNPNPGSQYDWERQQSNSAAQPRATVASSNPYSLGVGSRVQMSSTDVNEPPHYGVIRWIGEIAGASGTIAGIELDEYLSGCTDGTLQATGQKFFTCAHGKGLFFPLASLRPDGRSETASSQENPIQAPMEEQADQTIYNTSQQMKQYIRNRRGIQGHQNNSCYLDSTIFGLFALSDIFDTMFLDPDQSITTDQNRKRVADLLWKGIVNPLRKS